MDFRFTYELFSVPNIIGVIYATRTMGAVRIVKYKEENLLTLQKAHKELVEQIKDCFVLPPQSFVCEDHNHHNNHSSPKQN